jgi:hypothetical protein
MEPVSHSPIRGGRTMPFTAVPTAVPVPLPGVKSDRPPAAPGAFTIDCGDCMHRLTSVCDDCVVSFIVGRQPDDAVVVDAGEARAVRMLEQAGLVPVVRHTRQVS